MTWSGSCGTFCEEHNASSFRPCGLDAPNEIQRCLFSLPARLGGLNIVDPSSFSHDQFMAAEQVTGPLVNLILSDDSAYPYETLVQQIDTKNAIKTRR